MRALEHRGGKKRLIILVVIGIVILYLCFKFLIRSERRDEENDQRDNVIKKYFDTNEGVLGMRGGSKYSKRVGSEEGNRMLAFWMGDLILFETIFRAYDTYCNFVEIGTSSGFTSLYLANVMLLRDCEVNTWDIRDIRDEKAKKHYPKNLHFNLGDAEIKNNQKLNEQVRNSDFVWFDGMDKPEECRIHYESMKGGTIFFVHDWPNQVVPKGDHLYFENLEKMGKIKTIFEDLSIAVYSRTRAFMVLK